MLVWIKRIAMLFAVLLSLSFVAAWLLLSSSFLAKPRSDLTARILTDKLGQTVEITGEVAVTLGSSLHVTARGLALPSQSIVAVQLAEIGSLEFDIDPRYLLAGRVALRDLHVDQAKLTLTVDQEGNSSWMGAKPEPKPGAASKFQNTKIATIFSDHKMRFTNSNILFTDDRNGLDIDLLLSSLDLSRNEGTAPITLQASGSLNGENLIVKGDFPPDQPFKITADFSKMGLLVEGTSDQMGLSTKISLNVIELGQLLNALKLQNLVSGTGQVNAVVTVSDGSARVSDLNVSVDLDTGQSLKVTGDLGKLGNPADVSIDTKIRLYSEENRPPTTNSRRDLKLIGVDMQLIAQPNGIPKRGMVIETNGFTLNTSGEGPPPISVSEISRTADGLLSVGGVVLRIGPPDAPFLVLDGDIYDALRLKGVDFAGEITLPASNLLGTELFQTSGALGIITGHFRLSGTGTELGLSDLEVASQGTDLWHLKVGGSLRNALNFSDIDLQIAADISEGAKLLESMGLDPVETGKVGLKADLTSLGTEWHMGATIAMDETQLDIDADVDFADPEPQLSGLVKSDLVRIDNLRDIVAAALELRKLKGLEKEAAGQNSSINVQNRGEGNTQSEEQTVTELTDSAPEPSGPLRNVTLPPLVQAILLSDADIGVTIDLQKVVGEKGTTSLKAEFELKDQKAQLGPVKFEYGSGHFDLSGSMDLEKNPDILNVNGSTGGWNFGAIMHALRFKKGAHGTLYANFDVSGNHHSVQDFIGTMTGSATVSIANGSIDTQLLDLAGLGLIPWLFSKDRGKAADIICARAPLHISNGNVSFKQIVVETHQVQVVVYGSVDLKGKTLDVSGQPRRIGKPLSRSPWPFTIAGPITKPKVKVKDGPKRLRRSDGASTMPKKRKTCVPDILQLK